MDAVFTVTEFSMLAAVANTLRTPVDAEFAKCRCPPAPVLWPARRAGTYGQAARADQNRPS